MATLHGKQAKTKLSGVTQNTENKRSLEGSRATYGVQLPLMRQGGSSNLPGGRRQTGYFIRSRFYTSARGSATGHGKCREVTTSRGETRC